LLDSLLQEIQDAPAHQQIIVINVRWPTKPKYRNVEYPGLSDSVEKCDLKIKNSLLVPKS